MVYTFEDVVMEEQIIQDDIKEIPFGKDTCNILLLTMSTLNRIVINKYKFDDENILENDDREGFYIGQMEPTPKMLAKVLARQNQRLDYIYVLNTIKTLNLKQNISFCNKEYTAFEFFKERCSCLFNDEVDDRIINIPIETEDNTDDIERALYLFNKKISELDVSKINLYVDNHGGFRTKAFITDAISQLINIRSNIELKKTYSITDPDSKNKNSVDKTEDYYAFCVHNSEEIFNFVSGIKEFLNFGSSKSLNDFVKNKNLDEKDQLLINTINLVSESIRLCNINGFIESLKRLNNLINKREKEGRESYLDIVMDMIKNDYQVDKEHNLLSNQSIIYALKWCVKKDYIQQALTLIESKTGEYLERKQIISFGDLTEYVKEINKTREMFFTELYNDWINLALLSNKSDKTTYFIEVDDTILSSAQKEFEDIAESGYSLKTIYKKFEKYKNKDYFYDKTIYKINGKKEEYNNKRNVKNYYYTKNCKNQLEDENVNFELSLPYADMLVGNKEFIDALYNFLFIQKVLKFMRNKLNHFNNKNDKLNMDYIKILIEIYDVLLSNLENIYNKYK